MEYPELKGFNFKGGIHARRETDAVNMNLTVTNSSGALEATNVGLSGNDRTIGGSGNEIDYSGSTVTGWTNWEKSDGVLGNNTFQLDDTSLDATFDWFYMFGFVFVRQISVYFICVWLMLLCELNYVW